MDNQPRKITGTGNTATDWRTRMVNDIKRAGETLNDLCDALSTAAEGDVRWGIDAHWVGIGRTHLQQGFMALVRAVAKDNGNGNNPGV